MRGGRGKDGNYIVGDPVYFSPCAKKIGKLEGKDQLETEISVSKVHNKIKEEI